MKKFSVNVPISGYINLEVKADSEEDAIEKALSSVDLNLDNIVEWEGHEHLNEGNVCHAIFWNAEAEEIDSDNEE
jgi:hypothetical protein